MDKKTGFIVSQSGSIELTETLNSDFSVIVPFKLSTDNEQLDKAMKGINRLYYHDGEGWVPLKKIKGETTEVSVQTLCEKVDDDMLVDKLDQALNRLGSEALSNAFVILDKLWPITRMDVAEVVDTDIT